MGLLDNKVAVITGAASGIGKATALAYVAQGAKVLAADFNAAGLADLQQEVGDAVSTVQVDISKTEDANKLVTACKEAFGEPDILVNCAGIIDRFQLAAEIEDDIWDRVIAVNLTGTMKVTRALLQDFLTRDKGTIVTVSSMAGLFGARASGTAYTASKFGVTGMTKNLAFSYTKRGIRCNAIAPSGVETNIIANHDFSTMSPDMQRLMGVANGSMPRTGTADEIASIAVFLGSDESSFISGQVIAADAGWGAF